MGKKNSKIVVHGKFAWLVLISSLTTTKKNKTNSRQWKLNLALTL
jgi:hypothetical protein